MTGPKDGLQELGESWLGTLKLWFRKTGHQESFLSLPLCFCFVFPPFFPFLSLSLSISIKLWSGKAWLPTFDLVVLCSLLGGGGECGCCWSQQNCEKPQCCRPLRRQREGPAIWLRRESIYILNMPWSWHGLSSTISLWTWPVESLIPWQEGRLIPCTWHWTCPAVIVNMHILLCTKLRLSFPHRVRNTPVHVSLFPRL